MDHETAGIVPRKGMTIVGSDGETVGEIDLVEATYVIVTKGLFPQDYYIAVRDIVGQDGDDTLRLAIPAQEALDRGLGNPMVGAESEHTATVEAAQQAGIDVDSSFDQTLDTESVDDIDTSPDVTAGTEVMADVPEPEPLHADVDVADVDAIDTPQPQPLDAEVTDAEAGAAETDETQPLRAEADDPDLDVEEAPVRDDMHRTVTLSAEELSATTRPVERGVVHVEKKVIEEKVTLEVPLVEDEVHVTRRRVDREIDDAEALFQEDHLEIPLRGQGVEIEKRAHVVEEVDIDKTAHQEIREVTETVRHEEARVETDGAEGTEVDQTEDA